MKRIAVNTPLVYPEILPCGNSPGSPWHLRVELFGGINGVEWFEYYHPTGTTASDDPKAMGYPWVPMSIRDVSSLPRFMWGSGIPVGINWPRRMGTQGGRTRPIPLPVTDSEISSLRPINSSRDLLL